MRILVLSNTPWSSDNSFGNTFTNLFSGLDGIEVANIYTRYGMPDDNGVVTCYYQITEEDLLKKCHGRSFDAEKIPKLATQSQETRERLSYDFFRTHRLAIFYWARELLWKFGKWDTEEMRAFINEFRPDLIYLPMYYSGYMLDIGLFLKRYTGARMIGHISDDNYSLKQFSLSPFYWIDRFWKRKKIRAVVKECDFLHVITEKQKEEYERLLHVECRVFRKAMDFAEDRRPSHEIHDPIQYVYTGNLGSGRWKPLCEIGRVLDKLYQEKAALLIYSQTPLTKGMERAFQETTSIRFMGGVSGEECASIQQEADILVLVESSELRARLIMRLSLSTKVVDYLHTGNCILFYGTKEQAGFRYLKEGNAAVMASSPDELEDAIRSLNEEKIRRYANAAWEFGKKNHSNEVEKKQFYRDLLDACGRRE